MNKVMQRDEQQKKTKEIEGGIEPETIENNN